MEYILKILDRSNDTEVSTVSKMYDFFGVGNSYGTILKDKKIHTCLMVVADKIVGASSINFALDKPWLAYIIVDEKYRKMGYGANLLRFIEEQTKNRGFLKLNISSHWDLKSLGFYEKLGYKSVYVSADEKITTFEKVLE